MKKRDLEKKLKKCGWYLKRQGSNHKVWTNGDVSEPVPRHTEIGEALAKRSLKKRGEIPELGAKVYGIRR